MKKTELVSLFGKNQRQAALAIGISPQVIGTFADDLTRLQLKSVVAGLTIGQETRPEFVPEQLWKAIKE